MKRTSYNFSYTQKKQLKKKILIIITSFLLVLVGLQLVIRFLISPVFVASSSMEPCIVKNAAVFVLPVSQGRIGIFGTTALKRGDVVRLASRCEMELSGFQKVFNFIVNIFAFNRYCPLKSRSENLFGEGLYRLIGLPGDTLYIKNFIAYIRTKNASHFLTEFELTQVNYDILAQDVPPFWDMSMGTQGNTTELLLKSDEYFVLCDNRISAADSRFFGIVKEELINGRALWQYYPFTAIHTFN